MRIAAASQREPMSWRIAGRGLQIWRSRSVEIGTKVILPFVVTRVILLVIGLGTIYYILPLINNNQPIHSDLQLQPFSRMLYKMWVRFDSGFFIGIAASGYSHSPNALMSMSNWAFFPFYPIMIRMFAVPIGITNAHMMIVGIIISNISSLIACIYLYQLTTMEFNSIVAQRAVLYMLIYPMSFYLSAVYSEGLFLMLSIGCIFYARQRSWLLCGIFGGLAALTRSQGVVLVMAVAWEYWQIIAERFEPQRLQEGHVAKIREWFRSRIIGLWQSLGSLSTWQGFTCITLIPLCFALFCFYAKWRVNVFLAFLKVEENGWNRHPSNPILLMLHFLHHPIDASPWTWEFYAFNMPLIFLCWIVFFVIFCKLPFLYSILTFIYLYLPLAAGSIGSVGRLYLIAFPIYIILAWWSTRGSETNEWRHSLLLTVSTMLLGIGMVMFTIGIYAVA